MKQYRRWLLRLVPLFIVMAYAADRCGALPVGLLQPSHVPGSPSVWVIDSFSVVDGDTLFIAGQGKIRLVGIDTPEWNEVGGMAAKLATRRLTAAAPLTAEICTESPRDRYGRLLGKVYAGGVDVQAELVHLGLARSFTLVPCGAVSAARYTALFWQAITAGAGTWVSSPTLSPCALEGWENRVVQLSGRLIGSQETQTGLRLYLTDSKANDKRKRGCLTVQVAKADAALWRTAPVAQMIASLQGKTVKVAGKLKRNGKRLTMTLGHPDEIRATFSATAR